MNINVDIKMFFYWEPFSQEKHASLGVNPGSIVYLDEDREPWASSRPDGTFMKVIGGHKIIDKETIYASRSPGKKPR